MLTGSRVGEVVVVMLVAVKSPMPARQGQAKCCVLRQQVLLKTHEKMSVNGLICETLHPKNPIVKFFI